MILTYFYLKTFSAVPKLHVTVKHGTPNQKQDAMSVWIENISRSRFEVCLQESRTFDGPHSNIMVVRNVIKTVFNLSKNINIKSIMFLFIFVLEFCSSELDGI